MRPERWEHVEQLYHAARARAGGERSAFLDAACVGDAALRREVESLLAQQTSADGLLDRPAWASLLNEPSVALLAPGSQLGPYQILGLPGTGGMGRSVAHASPAWTSVRCR
jgi:hypothetical protein